MIRLAVIDIDAILKVADKLTAPVVLVFVVAAVVGMVKWAKPWGEKLFQALLDSISHTRASMDAITVDVQKHSELIQELSHRQDAIREHMEERFAELTRLTFEQVAAVRRNTDATLQVLRHLERIEAQSSPK